MVRRGGRERNYLVAAVERCQELNLSEDSWVCFFTWFDYFSRGVLDHDLAPIKVLKCELKATESLYQSDLVRHVQVVSVSLEHLGKQSEWGGGFISSKARETQAGRSVTVPNKQPSSSLRPFSCSTSPLPS